MKKLLYTFADNVNNLTTTIHKERGRFVVRGTMARRKGKKIYRFDVEVAAISFVTGTMVAAALVEPS